MSCDQDRAAQLTAYLDGELDLTSSLEFEAHLETCAECARALAAGRALRQAIGAAATDLRYLPSPDERRRLLRAAGALAPRRPPLLKMHQVRALAALLLVAVASYLVGRRWPAVSPATATPDAAAIVEQVVGSHVRSLLSGRPEDIESSGRHVIKPWFAGRLDFTPPIVDLTSYGMPLRGARLDYVSGRPVATLVYLVGTHLVSVYIWPADLAAPSTAGGEVPVVGIYHGFQIRHWSQVGMTWWAVSDATPRATSELVSFLRGELAR